jgi:hypothetical protein
MHPPSGQAPVVTPVVDYRTPGVGDHRVRAVLELLERDEATGMAAAWGKLALGVLLTLIGPFLVATVLVGVARRRGSRLDPPPGPSFVLVFSGCCVVMVPLLLWYERRTHGDFLNDAVRGEGSPTQASSYGEYELQKSKMTWIAYTEAALLGPRLLWHVYDWAKGTPAVHQPVRVVAAHVAVELLDAGGGVPIKRLARPDRPLAEVQWAVKYLQSRDWADVSKARDRAWLTTPTRERLAQLAPLRP